jgi:hypothetical protein
MLISIQTVIFEDLCELIQHHLDSHRFIVSDCLLQLLPLHIACLLQISFRFNLLLQKRSVLLLKKSEFIRGYLLMFGILRVNVEDER